MADNLKYNEPGTGPVLRAVDRSSVYYPVSHIAAGSGTALIDGDTTNGLDVDVTRIVSAVSTNNSTTATLGSGGVFTGTADDLLNYAAMTLSIRASHVSAADGISVQWSNDGTNWDRIEKWTYRTADAAFSICLRPKGRYLRVVYTNTAAVQTVFRLQTILHTISPREDAPLDNGRVVVDGISYAVKRASINVTATGDQTVIAAVTGIKLRILSLFFTSSVLAGVQLKSNATVVVDRIAVDKRIPLTITAPPQGFWMETTAGEAFNLNTDSAGLLRGVVIYIEVP